MAHNPPPNEILTTDQMYLADDLAIKSGLDSFNLMQTAGLSVIRVLRKKWSRRRVLVLCGPGNNGGDGFIVASGLKNIGWPVKLGLLGDKVDLDNDALRASKLWKGEIQNLSIELLDNADLIVDALFGAGLNREVSGLARQVIETINKKRIKCISVDIPSGINGDSGQIQGCAINANTTVTFFRKKPGHLMLPGRSKVGDLKVVNIGIPNSVLGSIDVSINENNPGLFSDKFYFAGVDDHKYSRGHAIISGGDIMPGAAFLASMAARRVGAGLVSIVANMVSKAIYLSSNPGTMFIGLNKTIGFDMVVSEPRCTAFLIGPGNGLTSDIKSRTISSLRSRKSVVLDADALTLFKDNPSSLFKRINGPVVLTPHKGEFLRLFDVTGNKIHDTRSASKKSGAVVVFKGGDTIIAAPDGRVAINVNSPPTLATAGSGDVLSGLITGLLATGMPAYEAACAGNWIHGEAASHYGHGLIAEDIIDGIPRVLRSLY
ncbi:MAG: bifunctional ADP-dependent NAD(P)H-hydrate dehydratase/NAD(P)H-hydrate epimerase [Rhodospirillaceae bacterium]|nr:bifunctional ADP-dependent NAD(P)H-hydrate dehydratase/NAD(P)H-hydrate epimerase [Rhodospirillaceae bacterium]OUT79787.1 MAG: hypothetical protein CBB83_02960 [Rhodospirillaceae bacterium TMED23]|tara:strand:- start:1013 stop:2479 length:1467 start_codon:yes stop_codon:yes gene_type:complete